MKYPKLQHRMRVEIKEDSNTYEIYNLITGLCLGVDEPIARLAKHLDGETSPYEILSDYNKEEVDEILEEMNEYKLFDNKRLIIDSWSKIYLVLWIPAKKKVNKTFIKKINQIFPVVSILTMILGIISIFTFDNYDAVEMPSIIKFLLSGYLGIIIILALHEIGHIVGGLNTKSEFVEAGFCLSYLLPQGYVYSVDYNDESKWKSIQSTLAGIEMQCLVGGIILLLATNIPSLFCYMIYIFGLNLIMMFNNLAMISGLDGLAAILIVLGLDEDDYEKRSIFKEGKELIRTKGINGWWEIYFILFMKLAKLMGGLSIILLIILVFG